MSDATPPHIIDTRRDDLTDEEKREVEEITANEMDPTVTRVNIRMLEDDLRKVGAANTQELIGVVLGWMENFGVGFIDCNILRPVTKIITGKPRVVMNIAPISININKDDADVPDQVPATEDANSGGPGEPS